VHGYSRTSRCVTIRRHAGLPDARGVGGIRGAVGLLHCLWWWCIDYATDGDLSRYDAEDIAIACEWEGDPDDTRRDARGDGIPK